MNLPDSLRGKRCTCRPGCTDRHVGDQRICAPDCEPCRVMVGVLHADVVDWQRERKAPK